MVHVRKHDRGGPNNQLPGLDWQSLHHALALSRSVRIGVVRFEKKFGRQLVR